MLGMPHLHVEVMTILNWLLQSSPWCVLVKCQMTGIWLRVDLNAYHSQLWEMPGFLNLLDLTKFSLAVHLLSTSKADATTGSFCTCLLGELDCRGEKTPSPRTGAAYIGLGEACLHPIGYAFSTSFTCLGPGSDSAKNSTAHAHIGCLPKLMGGGQR